MKEFNLSNEREKIVQFAELDEKRWKELMDLIRSQDKEFIKRLKEEFCQYRVRKTKLVCRSNIKCSNCEFINKLAGDDLK